jgi:carboxyl-terminal processing protease
VRQALFALALALALSGMADLGAANLGFTNLGVAVGAHAEQGFDAALAGRVFGAALSFSAPRTLDPVTPAMLTSWGLGGIAALDPALSAVAQGSLVRLVAGGRVLVARLAPPPDDAAAWGRLAAALNAAAYEASPRLRRAGGQALLQSFFDEMFSHLDPYSRYVAPAPAESVRDRLSVDAGAGFALVRRADGLVVASIVPGGPAADAGVRVGDRLLSVDHVSVRGRSLQRVEAMLTGPQGDERRLLVRGLDGVVRAVPLTLAFVPPETVFVSRRAGLLVLRVSEFDGNTAQRMSEAVEGGLAARPAPDALVLDLRGNRGGLLRQAVTSVALFAEAGVIASTAGRDPQATHDWRIDGGGDLTHGLKLIILVDGRTASAAEIMAAALADLGRAVVVGSSTLGKGLVQTITTLPDGGELYVTWSRVLAPRFWPIQTLGVMPQVCTSGGEVDTQHELADLADGHNDMAAAVAKTRAARPPLTTAAALALRLPCPAASGTDLDLIAAAFLAKHTDAYEAALLK